MQRTNVLILVSCFYLYAVNLFDVFVASVAQSSEPFTSEFVGPILATDSRQRSGESRGFSLTGKVDRVG